MGGGKRALRGSKTYAPARLDWRAAPGRAKSADKERVFEGVGKWVGAAGLRGLGVDQDDALWGR